MERLSRLIKETDADVEPSVIFDKEVNENIYKALTLLDEFHGMIEMIRDDSNTITEEHLQEFHAEALKMKSIYKEIDELQKVVNVIEDNCNAIDKALQLAENETNAFSLLRNTFRKVVSSGSAVPKTLPTRESILPTVFVASDLLSHKIPLQQS